jgi:hypothetical protein
MQSTWARLLQFHLLHWIARNTQADTQSKMQQRTKYFCRTNIRNENRRYILLLTKEDFFHCSCNLLFITYCNCINYFFLFYITVVCPCVIL